MTLFCLIKDLATLAKSKPILLATWSFFEHLAMWLLGTCSSACCQIVDKGQTAQACLVKKSNPS